VPHPSVGLVRSDCPVDVIWQGVLNGNDAALAATDLAAGPVHLLVQRLASGITVVRLDESAGHFADALCSGEPLQAALDAPKDLDASMLLTEHLAAQRFVGFTLASPAAGCPTDAQCGAIAS
jgi:hypothetical protein